MSLPFDIRAYESSWESSGQRVAALVDNVSAVAVIGDDLIAVAAATMGIARAQAARRLVYIGDMLGEESTLARTFDDASLGISDMIRFGVSLSRVAHNLPESSNLFALPAGAESPLAADVFQSERWRSLSELIHRGRGLLLLALPSRLPDVGMLLSQLDGVLVVGDTVTPPANVTVLGEVRTMATMRTPAMATTAVTEATTTRPSRRGLMMLGAVGVLLLAAIPLFRSRDEAPAAADTSTAAAIATDGEPLPPPPAAEARPQGGAAWSVEIAYTNSESAALQRVQNLADTLPVPTFAPVPLQVDSVPWYRVLSGAFPDSISAENFLRSLRERRVVAPTGGAAVYAPYAFVLDSASDQGLAFIRVRAYQGRGLPAYALHDSLGAWRIYVGAFASPTDAARIKGKLETLNIQSTLAVRVGSNQ